MLVSMSLSSVAGGVWPKEILYSLAKSFPWAPTIYAQEQVSNRAGDGVGPLVVQELIGAAVEGHI